MNALALRKSNRTAKIGPGTPFTGRNRNVFRKAWEDGSVRKCRREPVSRGSSNFHKIQGDSGLAPEISHNPRRRVPQSPNVSMVNWVFESPGNMHGLERRMSGTAVGTGVMRTPSPVGRGVHLDTRISCSIRRMFGVGQSPPCPLSFLPEFAMPTASGDMLDRIAFLCYIRRRTDGLEVSKGRRQ